MKLLRIDNDGSIAQFESNGPSVEPKLLKEVMEGEIAIARFHRDGFEYLMADARPVNAPTNSFDEVRQDAAINGMIYEIAGWEPMEIYDVNTGETRRAGENPVTLIDGTDR